VTRVQLATGVRPRGLDHRWQGHRQVDPPQALRLELAGDELVGEDQQVGARDQPVQQMFGDEINRLSEGHAGRFSVIRVWTRTPGATRPSTDDWHRLLATDGPLSRMAGVWLCGPEGLVTQLRPVLASLGVPHRRVHTELFDVAAPTVPPVQGVSTVRVLAGGTAAAATVPRSTWLLDAARGLGSDVPFSCLGGMCGACRARVLEGKVSMVTNHQLSAAEVAAGHVLTCRTRPVSRSVTVDFDS
jgi:ring-1,2-phenylacetyl-CoA epoxidase subunit PaaE